MRFVIPSQLIFVALIAGFSMTLAGCGSSTPVQPESTKRMVYVDTATMKPLVHEVAATFPAAHPQTGQRTLRPALYCSKCQAWYPVPDWERINRTPGAGLCPKDKGPLTFDGPWPDGTHPTATGTNK